MVTAEWSVVISYPSGRTREAGGISVLVDCKLYFRLKKELKISDARFRSLGIGRQPARNDRIRRYVRECRFLNWLEVNSTNIRSGFLKDKSFKFLRRIRPQFWMGSSSISRSQHLSVEPASTALIVLSSGDAPYGLIVYNSSTSRRL